MLELGSEPQSVYRLDLKIDSVICFSLGLVLTLRPLEFSWRDLPVVCVTDNPLYANSWPGPLHPATVKWGGQSRWGISKTMPFKGSVSPDVTVFLMLPVVLL